MPVMSHIASAVPMTPPFGASQLQPKIHYLTISSNLRT